MTTARALCLLARCGALAAVAVGAPVRAAGPGFDLAVAAQAQREPLFQLVGADEAGTRRSMAATVDMGVAWVPRVTTERDARKLSTWYRPRHLTTRGASVTVLHQRLVLSGFTLSRNRITVVVYTAF